MNELRISKIDIDALLEEFPVLTTQMMRMIMAGDGNKCVVEAMFAVSKCGGWDLSYNVIEDSVVGYLATSRGITMKDAKEYLNEKGLTNTETHQVISMVFGGMGATCGSATAGECNIIAFNTGSVADGKPVYHAGTLNMISNDGKAVITDGKGYSYIIDMFDKDGKSNIEIAYNIPKNTSKSCESGGSNNSGSGSTCGSGNYCGPGSGDDNCCGSGSSWY